MTSRPGEDGDDGSVDVEAAWADIVAHWDDVPDVPQLDDDRSGDDASAASGADGETPEGRVAGAPEEHAEREDWDAGDDWDVARSRVGGERARDAADRDARVDAALDDDRYQPPEPPPLPRGDLVSRLAWAGVLGAPVFFVFAALFWHGAPTWLVIGAVGAFVGGFLTLVVRMPDERDEDDDGAVV